MKAVTGNVCWFVHEGETFARLTDIIQLLLDAGDEFDDGLDPQTLAADLSKVLEYAQGSA